MAKYIICGVDLHEKALVAQTACDSGEAEARSFGCELTGRERFVGYLHAVRERTGAKEIVVAYEAGPHGFVLHDWLEAHEITCHVFAPTRLPHTAKSRRHKCDGRDADVVQQALRAHLLAGNDLPAIWVPDLETRDDREVIRGRIEAGEEVTRIKTRIRHLFKRWDVSKPKGVGQTWTAKHRAWLRGLTSPPSPLGRGARDRLASLLRQLDRMEEETRLLDTSIAELSKTPRYVRGVAELRRERGAGLLTAMTFLAELGDPNRFRNRREIGAFLGLVPSSNESGPDADRKGHITHQGSARLRKMLCQAAWTRVRCDEEEQRWYERVVRRGDAKKRRRLAIVGVMRRLAIRLWNAAKRAAAPLPSPRGGEAPACASGAAAATTGALPA